MARPVDGYLSNNGQFFETKAEVDYYETNLALQQHLQKQLFDLDEQSAKEAIQLLIETLQSTNPELVTITIVQHMMDNHEVFLAAINAYKHLQTQNTEHVVEHKDKSKRRDDV